MYTIVESLVTVTERKLKETNIEQVKGVNQGRPSQGPKSSFFR